MKAFIPVAGSGTRLRPHTLSSPKVLLNVAGKPILGHILDKLVSDGIDDVIIVIGEMGEMIKQYVSENYKIKVDYIVQRERKGLAHTVYIAQEKISKDESLLIILGDTIYDVDLNSVFLLPHSSIGVKQVDDPRRFGVVEIKNGFITKLIEKPHTPHSDLAIVGLYSIKNTSELISSVNELIEKNITTNGEYQLTDAIQIMINHGEKISTFAVDGWYDCGKSETILSTNRILLRKIGHNNAIDGNLILPPVSISPKAKIITSIIGPFTTVDENTKIEDSIVRNSIIGKNANIEKATLDNSIVGNFAMIKKNFNSINIGDYSEIDFY